MSIRYAVEPDILNWVVELSQKSHEEFEQKFPKFKDWLTGKFSPTVLQIKNIAAFAHVPVGYLFLKKPLNIEQTVPDFRTLKGQDIESSRYSKNLQDTLSDIETKQAWLREYRKKNGYEKLTFIGKFSKTDDIDTLVSYSQQLLVLSEYYDNIDKNRAFNYLIKALENIGIVVITNGIVGNNTHRKLDVHEFRGFTLSDEYAPVIFINGSDAASARIFTLMHEFCHLLLNETGISNNDESFCNKFAAKILVPYDKFVEEWKQYNADLTKIAEAFKVSRLVIYYVSYTYKYITEDELNQYLNEYYASSSKGTSGGNFYATVLYRNSSIFTETVMRAAKSGDILYGEAYDLLHLKGNTYMQVEAQLGI